MINTILRSIDVLRLIPRRETSVHVIDRPITELANKASQDPKADAELWEAIFPMIKRWVRGKTGGSHPAIRATEIVNRVYLALRKADPGNFPRREAFFQWVSKKMRGFIRDEITRYERVEMWMEIERIAGDLSRSRTGPDCAPTILAGDLVAAIDRVLEIDVEADSMLAMRAFTPATLLEIAEQHQVGVTHVKTKIAFARRIIRKELRLDE